MKEIDHGSFVPGAYVSYKLYRLCLDQISEEIHS